MATYLTPRQYSSDVTLYVALQGRAESSDAAYQASQLAKERVVSYAPLLRDERITGPVIDKLRLPLTTAELADRITVTVQPDTVVLSAAVTDTTPDGPRRSRTRWPRSSSGSCRISSSRSGPHPRRPGPTSPRRSPPRSA